MVEIDHPVCAGLEPTFEIRDEVYLFTVFEGDVTPLMQSHHTFTADNFYSANLAIRGQRDSKRDRARGRDGVAERDREKERVRENGRERETER